MLDALAAQLLVHKNTTLLETLLCFLSSLINCFKTTAFCQSKHCCNNPKTIIYCMQGCKRIHRHRFNEYIMVSNAVGGVNGKRRPQTPGKEES